MVALPHQADDETLGPPRTSWSRIVGAPVPGVSNPTALPPAVLRGIREFNDRKYYECHETLEAVWREERGPMRAMLHGMIQVAVGLLHTERANFKGAKSLLGRAIGKLQGLPLAHGGIYVASLLADTQRAYATVLSLGPSGIANFPWDQAPEIRMFTTESTEHTERTPG